LYRFYCFQLLLLQKEACALQAADDAGADIEAELENLEEQCLMKGQIQY
jgi:hypothetical protein